jgi:hypothetical protein
MANSCAFDNLTPTELARDAVTMDRLDFEARYGDAPMLLVRVSDGDMELELGLNTNGPSTGTTRATISEPLPFRTALQPVPSRPPPPNKGGRAGAEALRRTLEKHTYFGVSIRKRGDSDALFMDRVSVGRARNKDIVLRHSTISKFHAWFELSDDASVYVCDAGSTNLTYVNEKRLEPRIRTSVEVGDVIRFGGVETILSSSTALWTSFHVGVSLSLPPAEANR